MTTTKPHDLIQAAITMVRIQKGITTKGGIIVPYPYEEVAAAEDGLLAALNALPENPVIVNANGNDREPEAPNFGDALAVALTAAAAAVMVIGVSFATVDILTTDS